MKIRNIFIITTLIILIGGCKSYHSELSKAEQQAASGNAKIRFQLAMHYAGVGVFAEKHLRGHDQIDYKKSAQHLVELSESNHANAMYVLANLYSSHFYIDDENYLSTHSQCDAIDIINSYKKCFWTPSEELKKEAHNKHRTLIYRAAELGHTKALIQKSKISNDCTTSIEALKEAAYDNGSLLAALRLGIIYQSIYSAEYYQPDIAYKLLKYVESKTKKPTLNHIQLNQLAAHYRDLTIKKIRNKRLSQNNKNLANLAIDKNYADCQAEFLNTPALSNLLG